MTVLLLPHQGLSMPKCIQCTSLFYDQTIQGWAVFKSLCLSTLLYLIHKCVMNMVALLLWKCNSWLLPEIDFWSLVFYLTLFHSKIHQMAMSTQHLAQEERSGDRYAFRDTEGHRDLYREFCSPVCFYWNRSSCQVEISKTNTRQSFIRLQVLSTTWCITTALLFKQ